MAFVFSSLCDFFIALSNKNPSYLQANNSASTASCVRYQFINENQSIGADELLIEAPLQLSLLWQDEQNMRPHPLSWMITMRTPGDDLSLVIGLLISQGLLSLNDLSDLIDIASEETKEQQEDDEVQRSLHEAKSDALDKEEVFVNELFITLKSDPSRQLGKNARQFTSFSSCGVCGANAIKALSLSSISPLDCSKSWLSIAQIKKLPDLLRAEQYLFERTGASHCAGYFVAGAFSVVKEDIGRHNAVDKLIGQIALRDLWHAKGVLVLSGRVSFELIQKALISSIPVIVSIGAPSSLVLTIAQQFEVTLIGFTRADRFNVYHGDFRLK